MCYNIIASFLFMRTDSFADQGTGPLSPSHAQRHEVKPVIRKLQNVHIPTSALPPHPHPPSTGRSGRRKSAGVTSEADANDDDALQDWNEKASVLFEWIGMINIGAQRYCSSQYHPRDDCPNRSVPDCKLTIEWTHTLPFTPRRPHPPLATWCILSGKVS